MLQFRPKERVKLRQGRLLWGKNRQHAKVIQNLAELQIAINKLLVGEKNADRRFLVELSDTLVNLGQIVESEQLWMELAGHMAYAMQKLERKLKEADLEHLVEAKDFVAPDGRKADSDSEL